MASRLAGRSYLKELDWSGEELSELLALAADLKAARAAGTEERRLVGRNVALLFEKASTRTRAAFEVAAHDQGAHVTYFGETGSHLGAEESLEDTARVLGRLFDGVAHRGHAHERVEILAAHAGIPVWNALSDDWHPTQTLADVLTLVEVTGRPASEVRLCFIGDTRSNQARSLLVGSATLGMEVRLCGPKALWPPSEVLDAARSRAARSGARLALLADPAEAVRGVDAVYTDVWVSMGEPEERWEERLGLLRPYRVTAELLEATGNPDARFLHCLPALHDRGSALGRRLAERTGLEGIEVADEVFTSEASVVFDQAENRLHTIKAVMVATLAG